MIIPVLAVFGVVGTIILIRSFAATGPTVSYDVENGTVSGKAAKNTGDDSASGGGYITLNSSGDGTSSSQPQPVKNVKDFGAKGDGSTNDTAAIQNAIKSLGSGGSVYFPAGTYVQNDLIEVNKSGVVLWGYSGAVIKATNPERQSIKFTASDTGLYGLTLTSTSTVRLGDLEDQRVVLMSSNHVVKDNTIKNSSATGIFIFGAADYLIENNTIEDTLADGIHNTAGAKRGTIKGNTLRHVGDDSIAVVSYRSDSQLTENITVTNNKTYDGVGRGLTVVGGRNITFQNNHVENTRAAGVYVAAESSYATYGGHNIKIIDNTIVKANYGAPALDHSAIFIYGDYTGTVQAGGQTISAMNEDILIGRNTIRDTLSKRAHITVRPNTARVNVLDNKASGGTTFWAGPYEFAVPSNTYNSRGNTLNGTAVPQHIGNAGIIPANY